MQTHLSHFHMPDKAASLPVANFLLLTLMNATAHQSSAACMQAHATDFRSCKHMQLKELTWV